MKALVLSGGGSKGAYQIGVWKALRKLHIKFDIVTGTSSGAINGALITQNTYYKALRIWKNLSYKKIFGEDIIDENTNILELYKMFAKNFILEKGTEVDNLYKLIKKNINKNKFYKSKINYGLVTVNISNKRPLLITKDKIDKDKIADYILASASCYPAFKKKEIDGKNYIDGGYYDNLPINLAIKMGADEAIIVDLEAIGIKRITKGKIKKTIIKPNNSLSNFLVFDKESSKRNIKYGYNDTLKVFNKLEGNKYTFKLNELDKIDNKYMSNYKEILSKVFNKVELINEFKSIINIERKEKIKKELLKYVIEDLGYKYKIDDSIIYTSNKFNKLLIKKVKQEIKNNNIDNTIFLYNLLKEENYRRLKRESLTKPIDLIRAIYLYTIIDMK